MYHSILFITDNYQPFPSSNGVCVSRIVKAYDTDSNVFVLSFANNEKCNTNSKEFYCEYQRKPSTFFNRIFSFCEDSEAVEKLYEKASEIIDRYKVDTVVCVYRPVECILAGLKLKRLYKNNICVLGYLLDNIAEIRSSSVIKDYIFDYNQKRLLRRLDARYDGIIALKYYKDTLGAILYKSKKIRYVGLPALENSSEVGSKVDDGEIDLIYAGSFYPDCRRPDEILEFIEKVCECLPKLKVHFYSWGCEEMVEAAKARMGDSLVLHGRVPASEAQTAIRNADILLNVGNDLPYAIPGKLFEYFATGKPIINFCYRYNDGATEDCLKYGNVFNVYSKAENNVEDCVNFIEKRTQLSWQVISETFKESLPKYTVNQINKMRGVWKDV